MKDLPAELGMRQHNAYVAVVCQLHVDEPVAH